MESTNSCSGSTASAFPASILPVEEGAFKCKLCPRVFKNARARGGHQKAHSNRYAPKKNKKAIKGRRPVRSLEHISPCFNATALRSACLRAQPFGDWCSHYDPSARLVSPLFPWQTGTGAGSLAVAPAAGGTGDGAPLLRLQDMHRVSQEEPADGIDLTLKL